MTPQQREEGRTKRAKSNQRPKEGTNKDTAKAKANEEEQMDVNIDGVPISPILQLRRNSAERESPEDIQHSQIANHTNLYLQMTTTDKTILDDTADDTIIGGIDLSQNS